MNRELEKMWRWEFIGISEAEATLTDTERALQQFVSTIRFVEEEKRYEVGFLFIDEKPKVPLNYKTALKVASAQWHRHKNEPEKLDEYNKAVWTLVDENVAEAVQGGILGENPDMTSYVPHLLVHKDGKKPRLVFNASACPNVTPSRVV